MSQRFVVINPPSEFLIDDRAFLSLGPLQIATTARDIHGWDVEVLDLTGHLRRCLRDGPAPAGPSHRGGAGAKAEFLHDDPRCEAEIWEHCEDQIRAAAARRPDLWGFYSMSCHLATNKRLLALVRRHAPGARTVIGGPHASLDPDDCIRVGFDYIVRAQTGGGGGEAPFGRLLAAAIDHGWHAVPWPSVWDATDQRGRGPADDENAWPFPDRRLVDHGDYHFQIGGHRAASVVTQYGCPYSCSFCSHGVGYTVIRYRSEDHVRRELAHIADLGYRAVMVYDDEINIRKDHFATLCRLFQEFGLTWRAFIKANLFTADQAEMAAASGAVALCTGAEAADAVTLKAIRKASDLADNSRFVRLCVANGIAPKVFTMVGLPTQDRRACLALRDWLLEMVDLGLRDYDVTVYTPYPGTPYFDRPEDFGIRFRAGKIDYADRIVNYKGRPGEYVGWVDTDHLTSEEIVDLREIVDRDVRQAVEAARRLDGSALVAGDRFLQDVYSRVDGG